MKDRNLAKFMGVLVLIMVVVACQQAAPPFECTDSIGCVDIPPDEPLKLAEITTLTGPDPLTSFSAEVSRGFEMALSNRSNEMLGHPITIQQVDDECSGAGGANAALKVVADPQIVAIFGTLCSGAAVEVSPIMAEAGLVMLSANN